ncbi:hypothetical protein B9J93_23155 [Vibrio sp. V17_P4S1T151]|uniref:hypothetical protein n=1 Tax=unclassified Vibrio TaxID=2614977 RepID=UPI000B8E5E94|nr:MULTISPECIES: hypothetical protein [unclassified Vibrio]OXX40006.1 hypothetical protein B9J93_23155 [Vibrio sp. V17_P4S1T151]OXX64543.1 hypothetical protein B9J89_01225 [Vibrio sp. V15_P4S5T153]
MNKNIELINKSITYIVQVIESLNDTSDELTKEAIEGYGFSEIKDAVKSEDLSESTIHSYLLSLIHIFDVLDEELCMESDFYDLKDEVESISL